MRRKGPQAHTSGSGSATAAQQQQQRRRRQPQPQCTSTRHHRWASAGGAESGRGAGAADGQREPCCLGAVRCAVCGVLLDSGFDGSEDLSAVWNSAPAAHQACPPSSAQGSRLRTTKLKCPSDTTIASLQKRSAPVPVGPVFRSWSARPSRAILTEVPGRPGRV
eukprot:COSAG01_NODE_3892_length_5578_cov_5.863296_7_plen_164_part_00